MITKPSDLTPPLFTYYAPTEKNPIGLISIPHSGENIPHEFKKYLTSDQVALARDVDTKVHELVDIPKLQAAGVGVLVAHIHRTCVDLNRAPEQTVLCWKENTFGEKCVVGQIQKDEELEILARYHKPYFEVMRSLLHDMRSHSKGRPINFIDLHSMPSKPTAYHLKQNPNQKISRSNICLSDQRGKTCQPEFIKKFFDQFVTSGYSCSINDPYIGGYITIFADDLTDNNIQIEINRDIYLNEITRELRTELVAKIKPELTQNLIAGFEYFFNQT